MTQLAWPAAIVPPTVDLRLDPRTVSGGVSLTGKEQVIAIDAARWRADLVDIPIAGTAAILAWRNLITSLQGRLNTVIMPAFDKLRAPWPIDRYGRVLDPGFYRRQSLAGTAFDPTPAAETLITATLAGAAALRATTGIKINVTLAGALSAGHRFSIGIALYEITAITDYLGSLYTVNVMPPLRAAGAIGDVVNFANPKVEMHLTSDNQGHVPLRMHRFGTTSLEFLEA